MLRLRLIATGTILVLLAGCGRFGATGAGTAGTSSGLRDSIVSLRLAGTETAWAVTDHRLFRAATGSSWTAVTPPGASAIADLAVIDAKTAVAAWFDLSHQLHVGRTTSGGSQWQVQVVQGATGASAGLSFPDSLNGRLVLVQPHAVGEIGGGVIYNTTDGGLSWGVVQQAGPWAPIEGIRFVDAVRGWGVNRPMSGNILFHTLDGGASWTKVDLPPVPQFPANQTSVTLGLPTFYGDEGVEPADLDLGEARSAVFYVTHDGGITWSVSPPLSDAALNGNGIGVLSPISISGPSAWSVAGTGRLTRTIDGGLHWETLTIPVRYTPNDLHVGSGTLWFSYADQSCNGSVQSKTSKTVTECQAVPKLYRSKDNGRSWAVVSPSSDGW